jgi:hypothetical protein
MRRQGTAHLPRERYCARGPAWPLRLEARVIAGIINPETAVTPARCIAGRRPPWGRLDGRSGPSRGNSIRMRQTRPSPTICTSPEVLDSRFRIIGPAPVSSAARNEPIRDGLFAPPLVVMTRAVSRGLRAAGLATEAAPKARAASWAVVRAAGLVRASPVWKACRTARPDPRTALASARPSSCARRGRRGSQAGGRHRTARAGDIMEKASPARQGLSSRTGRGNLAPRHGPVPEKRWSAWRLNRSSTLP